jgi:gluconate 2-dehydrogenase alpha chain
MTGRGSAAVCEPAVLSGSERSLLAALADVLFPELDGDGLTATTAGAVDYVLGLLQRDPHLREVYRSGLAFVADVLGPDRAIRLAAAAEDEAADWLEGVFRRAHGADIPLGLTGMPAPAAVADLGKAGFILILWQHIRQGLFGDPRHGGNKDACVWSWLGYSGPQMRGYTDSEVLENRLISRPLRTADDWRADEPRR